MDKKMKQKLYINIALVIVAVIMIVVGFTSDSKDAASIGSLSGAILGVGIARIIQFCKMLGGDQEALKKLNESYDERNIMIDSKAMSATMKICLCAMVGAMFILYLLEKAAFAQMIAWILCGCIAIYLICYAIYSKKY